MNLNQLAKHYGLLSPKERFQLILAAGARQDVVEQERLARSSNSIQLRTTDYTPWGNAFNELATTVFLHLIEDLACYEDWQDRLADAEEDLAWQQEYEELRQKASGKCDEEAGRSDIELSEVDEHRDGSGDAGKPLETEDDLSIEAVTARVLARQPGLGPDELEQAIVDEYNAIIFKTMDDNIDTLQRRHIDKLRSLSRYNGFLLLTRVAGWKLFCERLGIPPYAVWAELPGFHRLRAAVEPAKGEHGPPIDAFDRAGMERYLSEIGSIHATDEEPTSVTPPTPESYADDFDQILTERARFWGAKG